MGRKKNATTALVPAAARAPEVLSAEEADLSAEAVETFAKAVGGRDALTDVLSVAATAPEVEKVVNLLLDHRYRQTSLRRLCTMAGITVADLFAAYKKAIITRAHIEAAQIIAQRLPPIVTDVMDRALSDPTVDRQKLALELGQLTEKKGGLFIQQNTGVVAAATVPATGTGQLEQLQQAVGELLFHSGRRRASAPTTTMTTTTPEDVPDVS